MKIFLIILFFVLASITSTLFAKCPSQLNTGDMLECIMVEVTVILVIRNGLPNL